MKSNAGIQSNGGKIFFSSVEKSYLGFRVSNIVPKIPLPFGDIILVDINNFWIR